MRNPRNGGRKPKGDRPKTKIPISIDSDLLAQVDALAGDRGRSGTIEDLIRIALNITNPQNKTD